MNDRLKARIGKLEIQTGSGDLMTPDAMDAAAAAFERKLRKRGVPGGGGVEDALVNYRRVVSDIRDGAIQRAVAGFDPVDFEL